MKTLIKHARVLNPATQEDRVIDVLIEEGFIRQLAPLLTETGAERVDADGLWLTPGLVDIHVHLREPGQENKETIATGTRAAAAGGITSVVCMGDTSPPVDNRTGVEFILDQAKITGSVHVYPAGILSKEMKGQELSPIGEIVEAGAKAIMDDGIISRDPLVMRRAMEYSTIFNIPLIMQPLDPMLSANGPINEGSMSMKLGLIGSPPEAEAIQVARNLILAKKTGAHVHLAHLSTAEAVDLLRFYKKKGVKATGETSPHYLVLTEEETDGYNTNAKIYPPLRTLDDQEALYDGLRDGTIDCITSDHSPHTPSEKNCEFAEAPFGIVGLETLLPLLLNSILERSGLDLLTLLSLVTYKPAEIMNLPAGELEIGAPADFCLWNPQSVSIIDRDTFYSKSQNTPFHGWKVQGRVEATYVKGKRVYSHDSHSV